MIENLHGECLCSLQIPRHLNEAVLKMQGYKSYKSSAQVQFLIDSCLVIQSFQQAL